MPRLILGERKKRALHLLLAVAHHQRKVKLELKLLVRLSLPKLKLSLPKLKLSLPRLKLSRLKLMPKLILEERKNQALLHRVAVHHPRKEKPE